MDKRILPLYEIERIYGNLAPKYDLSVQLFRFLGFRIQAYRKKAVENLRLNRGNTVVDLGCGTGLNFEFLENIIGPEGKIIGVDLSDSMLKQAELRIKKNGWQNVTLIQKDMETYNIPGYTDAVLSTLAMTMSPRYDEITHKIAKKLPSGKRMTIMELKKTVNWPDWVTRVMIFLLKSYGTRYDHSNRTPWLSVREHFPTFFMQEFYGGAVYVATGIA